MWVKVCACVVLTFGLSQAFLDDAVEVIKLGKEIGEDVLASWEIFGKGYNVTGGVQLPFGERRRERAVLARLAQITRAIQRVESELVNTRSLSLLLASAGRGTRLELRLLEASDLLARVGAAEAQMREYVRYQEQLERSTLESFALWCVSPDRGALPGLVERIHALVAPPTHAFLDKGILALAVDSLQMVRPLQQKFHDPLRVVATHRLENTALHYTGSISQKRRYHNIVGHHQLASCDI